MNETELTEPTHQITLPGQAATIDGPLDMTMMYVMHHAFRRDLHALTAAAEATPLSARSTWRALSRRWDLFAFALHHHHTGEDNGYWPLLMQRVDGTEVNTLWAMEAEHAAIDPLLAACAAGFHSLARRASDPERVRLVESLRSAVSHLEEHLAHEETDGIALLQRHLTREEDERIEAEHFRSGVSVGKVAEIVPWALHEVPDDVRRRVFAATGLPYKILWHLTRERFARQDARALRYL